MTRFLIVNADDFGQSLGVNRGIIEACERGIVTSASLMVRWPAAEDAVVLARRLPSMSLGLHFDLGEWMFTADEWCPLYEVVPLDDAGAVAAELARQVSPVRRLTGRLPTHLESHQHVHRDAALAPLFQRLAAAYELPLRDHTPRVTYCGSFYGQTDEGTPIPNAIGVPALLELLGALPNGLTELGCHPAIEVDFTTMYRDERRLELRTLCDPSVRTSITRLGIGLDSFLNLSRIVGGDTDALRVSPTPQDYPPRER